MEKLFQFPGLGPGLPWPLQWTHQALLPSAPFWFHVHWLPLCFTPNSQHLLVLVTSVFWLLRAMCLVHTFGTHLPPWSVWKLTSLGGQPICSPRPAQAEQTNSRDCSSPARTILTYNLHCFQYFLVELNYGSPSTVVFLDSFWWFGFLPFFCPPPPHLWSFQTIYPSISLPHQSCTQDLHLGKPSRDNYESFNYSERNGYSCC